MHGSLLLKELKITPEKGKRTKRPSDPWAYYSCPVTDRALLTVLLCQGPQPCTQTHVTETMRNDRHLLANPLPSAWRLITFTGHFNKPRSRGSGAGILCQTLYAGGPSGWVWHKGSGVLPKWMQLCFNPRQARDSEKQALMEERPLAISRSWTASSQEYGWDPTAHNLLMLKPLEASWTHSPGKKALTCSQGCAKSMLKGYSHGWLHRQIWWYGQHSAEFPESNSAKFRVTL